MRLSKCVPPVMLIAAMGVMASCGERVADPLTESGYVHVEGRGVLSLCQVAPSAQVTGVVGPTGGSLAAGGVSMTLPPGAVLHDTEFRLHVPSSPHAEVEIHANGQDHFQFDAPVVIAMDYSRCGTPTGTLSAWHIDPETKALLEDMGGVDDVVNRRVVFSTMHLSGYAIAN